MADDVPKPLDQLTRADIEMDEPFIKTDAWGLPVITHEAMPRDKYAVVSRVMKDSDDPFDLHMLWVENRPVIIGNPLESTPDGLYAMDRVRLLSRQQRERLGEQLSPAGLAIYDEVERRFEHAVICGTPCEHYPASEDTP